jgi:DNA-binding CsgD family transcriptional regulator
MKDTIDLYEEIFISNREFKGEIVGNHIKKYIEIDNIYPQNQSFFIVINTSRKSYEFISQNFNTILGHDISLMKSIGPKYFLSFFHPDDLPLWLNISKELMDYTSDKVDFDDRKKLLFTYNFRIKNASGKYQNILAHLTPIEFDTFGTPVMAISHYTIVGEGDYKPLIGAIKILNKKNVYETLFYKNYSHEALSNKVSKREIDIIQELALNKSSKEIADRLCISSHTVDQHRRNILKKLNFKSTGELIQYCKTNNYF